MKIVIEKSDTIFSSEFFNYLSEDDKRQIYGDLLKEKSIVVGVYKNDVLLLHSVIELFFTNYIHVREVAGKQIFSGIGSLEIFCTALAKRYNREKISFCTDLDGIEYIGERMGYIKVNDNEFEKVVNV